MPEIKVAIQNLIDKYEAAKQSGKLKSYSEEETKRGFIEPLFEILGWNIGNKNEVTLEEQISGDRVDYGFYLNRRIKFYLEAKKFSADIHREDFANQAVRYSWNKGATWAILTNFESILVFNAQDIDKSLADKLFFEIPYDQFLERFDQLQLLSKESFANDLLDKEGEKYGKKLQKVSVTTLLYKDLQKCRDILTDKLASCNPGLNQDLLDEGVQKLLDRLLFLRVAEDRGIESPTLIPMLRKWEADGRKIPLYQSMIEKFRELDAIYDSNLFSPHPFEKWEEYGGATEDVIQILYGKKGYYEYDFKVMPADVLGAVYESYLGHRLEKSKKGITVAQDAKKRKEQGIYYTPHFIVDYIVKNALGPVLDRCKTINDLKKIKVLDPACGSGSFLIKALELINDKYQEFGGGDNVYNKIQILLENIYGVDLDPQAVEICRLNLLINALDKRQKLPLLENIKNGNSLISGTDKELEKYFGKNWRDKKPFNWQEEFPDVFKQGGFDVIIGNPPYVVLDSDDDSLPFLRDKYISSEGGKTNLYKAFIERSIKLLGENGHLGFICPSNYLSSADSKSLRKFILNETNIIEIVEYSEEDSVFEGVTQALTTIILKKSKEQNLKSRILTKKHGNIFIDQKEFIKNKTYEFISDNQLIRKLNQSGERLDKLVSGYQGEINVSTKKDFFVTKKGEKDLPLLRGNLIERYAFAGDFNEFCPISIDTRKHWNKERIVFQEVSNQQQSKRIKANIISNVLCGHTTNYCFPTDKRTNILALLALLNSAVFNYYFKYFNNTNHVPIGEVKKIPVSNNFLSKQQNMAKLADNMLSLNKELRELPENSEKWKSTKSEIEKTDRKIDEEVYKLYGLTSEEIKIVEK